MLHGRWPRISASGASLALLEADLAAGLGPVSEARGGDRGARGRGRRRPGRRRPRPRDRRAGPLGRPGCGAAARPRRRGHGRRRAAGPRVARDGGVDSMASRRSRSPGRTRSGCACTRGRTRNGEPSSPWSSRRAWPRSSARSRPPAARWCWSRSPRRSGSARPGRRRPTMPSGRCSPRRRPACSRTGRRCTRCSCVTGGSAWPAGAPTILDAPYQSYLFDLIDGPDNWYLVRAAPGDRGIVCGAHRADSVADQAPELVWAARYAASSNARGLERVGVANGAGSIADVAPDAVRRAAEALARATRLAPLPLDEAIAQGLDPRTIRQPFDPPTGRRRRRPTNARRLRLAPPPELRGRIRVVDERVRAETGHRRSAAVPRRVSGGLRQCGALNTDAIRRGWHREVPLGEPAAWAERERAVLASDGAATSRRWHIPVPTRSHAAPRRERRRGARRAPMRNAVAADAPRWDYPVSAWHRDRPRRLAHPHASPPPLSTGERRSPRWASCTSRSRSTASTGRWTSSRDGSSSRCSGRTSASPARTSAATPASAARAPSTSTAGR